jgi:uncharacterized protein with ATP-grasp and redox domains
MRTAPECVPCYFKQVASVAARCGRRAARDVHAAYRATAALLPRLRMSRSPAENTFDVLRAVQRILRAPDPFGAERAHFNRVALALLPRLQRAVSRSPRPLITAAHVAAAGNIIDLGILTEVNIHAALHAVLRRGFAHDDSAAFERLVESVDRILYLLDNAGEIVFDRVLIEELVRRGKQVTAVVNREPILNDALMQDAHDVGLTAVCRVITSGSGTIGKIPGKGSPLFRREFRTAPLIIAKGHGNFETLDRCQRPLCFILKAKCAVVARHLGVRVGDAVLKLRTGSTASHTSR